VRHNETDSSAIIFEGSVYYERFDWKYDITGTYIHFLTQTYRIWYYQPEQTVSAYYGGGLRLGLLFDNYAKEQSDTINTIIGPTIVFGGVYSYHRNLSFIAESQYPLDYQFNDRMTDTVLIFHPYVKIGIIYYF